ncbi:MAG TPA: cation-transporting P-type ATPase [Caldilineaceae bacterium]|nr:cation-transporting P-type ATPase [Caldilineaceae bacterium]
MLNTKAFKTPAEVASLRAEEVFRLLETQLNGLSHEEAESRARAYGRNALVEVKGRPLFVKFLVNFTHLMAILLWIGGIVAFLAQMPQLGIAIWLVNLINGAFSFWQEYKAEQATAALRRLLPAQVRVLRDGEEKRIPAEALVPGDVMLLAEGDHISADARVVHEAELRVDQSTLTGESRPVRKSAEPVMSNGLTSAELPNLVFAGTNVATGACTAVVFATGMATEFGKIAHLTQSIGEELSPLQQELNVVTRIVTVIAVGVGLVFFVLAVLLTGMRLGESFIFGLGMIVAFVPEGLLPTVTLALAMGVQRMARRHALIKRLSAVETLGCTSVILSDKTGTLTQNEMTVSKLYVPGRRLTVSGVGYSPDGQIWYDGRPLSAAEDPDLRQLLTIAGLCNDARVLPPDALSQRWTVLGDPTEAALCVVANKGGLDLEAAARAMPRLHELPFDSRRKRMTTIHQVGKGRMAFVKGAPKEVLGLCEQLHCAGHTETLDDRLRREITEVNDDYARQGLRVLAVAQRALPNVPLDLTPESVERALTFVGLVAMVDPPRPEVAASVQQCERAGIRIIMITGDYGLTAESIARRIGIIKSDRPRLITGTELERLDDAALAAALGDEVIFARVAPEHKLRVVRALQAMGHVVAVTGDGVNDAPALKQADIGVAMGVAGTDVAREAADMVLTDDNFASIVGAVEEGRAVYANIKKFTSYIFTSNTPEAVPFIIYALSGGRVPLALNIMQILAIDLGTDLVPALALGAEPPGPGVMEQPPRRLDEHVITPGLLARAYLWLGPLQSLAAMAAFYFLFWTNGYWGQWLDLPASGELYRAATTMTLAAVVTTQIGNLFAQRAEQSSLTRIGWFSNPLIGVGILTELTIIGLLVYVPFLQGIFGTAALGVGQWLFLFAWAPTLLVADELRKVLLRRRPPRVWAQGDRIAGGRP